MVSRRAHGVCALFHMISWFVVEKRRRAPPVKARAEVGEALWDATSGSLPSLRCVNGGFSAALGAGLGMETGGDDSVEVDVVVAPGTRHPALFCDYAEVEWDNERLVDQACLVLSQPVVIVAIIVLFPFAFLPLP